LPDQKGAGKTTFAREFLPKYAASINFVNVDLIAQGIAPLSPETASIRAGKLMLSEIDRLRRQRCDFGFETTLSGKTYLNLLKALKADGYRIHIYFLWIPGVELALSRVKGRVMEGGHNVPAVDVRRRFARSMRNFFTEYWSLADSWILFDNSEATPIIIASQERGKLQINRRSIYEGLIRKYAKQE
jgi:predicted ABC-type ATPase